MNEIYTTNSNILWFTLPRVAGWQARSRILSWGPFLGDSCYFYWNICFLFPALMDLLTHPEHGGLGCSSVSPTWLLCGLDLRRSLSSLLVSRAPSCSENKKHFPLHRNMDSTFPMPHCLIASCLTLWVSLYTPQDAISTHEWCWLLHISGVLHKPILFPYNHFPKNQRALASRFYIVQIYFWSC